MEQANQTEGIYKDLTGKLCPHLPDEDTMLSSILIWFLVMQNNCLLVEFCKRRHFLLFLSQMGMLWRFLSHFSGSERESVVCTYGRAGQQKKAVAFLSVFCLIPVELFHAWLAQYLCLSLVVLTKQHQHHSALLVAHSVRWLGILTPSQPLHSQRNLKGLDLFPSNCRI